MAATIDYSEALRLGFPANPKAGQRVLTADGRVWVWPHQPGQGLSDLGQWVEAISAGVGLLGKIFGFGGGPKPDNAARAALQQQQEQMAHLQAQVDEQSLLQPKYVFLFAVAGLALVMAFRK